MMLPVSRNLEVVRTARYWLSGEPSGQTHTVVILLHGYAMSALDCLKQFGQLAGPGVLLVAPEGLSRFYRRGFDGEVVASWMTREDRASEIRDQKTYLDQLLEQLQNDLARHIPKVIVVGYSQGAATGSRWVVSRKGAGITHFVVVAGELAPDALELGWPLNVNVLQVFSETDEFIPSSKFHEQATTLQLQGIPFRSHCYLGRHEVLPEVVLELKQLLDLH